MKKVLSFSLWGNQLKYTIGAIKNADLAKKFYSDFECWFYIHKDSVPCDIIEELKKKDNVKIILKEGNIDKNKPRMWRYEAIDDPEVEIMLSRDTDTRIWEREVLAVKEWLDSDKLFHIMRDHPHHSYHVLGGMFGTKKIYNFNWLYNINNYKIVNGHFYDQDFLRDYIYPLIKNNSIIHATFHKWESHAKDFPTQYNNDYNFVGEYVYEDDSRSNTHIDILKNSL